MYSNLRYNITVNVLDGAFFGLAWGSASFFTVIPLFVSTMTDSATLIGLIPAIHAVGWQLPQLLTANRVSQATRIKPFLMWLTLQERLPYLGLAIIALFVPSLGKQSALALTFFVLIWQGLGSGLAANPWQSLIAKIIPSDIRGTFIGGQAAAANILASLGAIVAGFILEKYVQPFDFFYCFVLASVALTISGIFLALTRETEKQVISRASKSTAFLKDLQTILRREPKFRQFLVIRSLLSFATLAFAFYAVYAVRTFGISEARIGVITGVMMATQIAANPIMGWLGDRWGHRVVMEGGVIACIASAFIAWFAPHPNWFFLVFILAGIGNVAVWTIGMTMSLEFGTDEERPSFIGLTNTLVAPSTILAPFLGGWLADTKGYPATFSLNIVCGGIVLILLLLMKERQPSPALSKL